VLDGALVEAVIADMAGKPFEYEAQMSARAPLMHDVAAAEVGVAEEPVETKIFAEESIPEVAVRLAAVAESVPEPIVVPEPVLAPNAEVEALTARVTKLEQRVSEQEGALRRVVAMMIDWMDKEGSFEARLVQNSRAA
jgi:general secretion pathway protein A